MRSQFSPESIFGYPESDLLSIKVFYAQKEANLRPCKGNCRSIEVDILYPSLYLLNCESFEYTDSDTDSTETIMEQAKNPSLNPENPLNQFESHALSSPIHESTSILGQSCFPFLSLPIENRLKIYLFLLPPRHHKITSQVPHNGYYFSPISIPLYAARSFYPISSSNPQKLTTYKVLSANSHRDYPNPSIHTRILSVCKQSKEEAEEVLYGNANSTWDFGMSIEAIQPFWLDRSQSARGWARNLRIAKELPGKVCDEQDPVWDDACELVTNQFSGLRHVDLTVWGVSILEAPVMALLASGFLRSDKEEEDKLARKQAERDLVYWESTRKLLDHEGLRSAKITWWKFGEGVKSFLAKWMLESALLTEEMVREGQWKGE